MNCADIFFHITKYINCSPNKWIKEKRKNMEITGGKIRGRKVFLGIPSLKEIYGIA